MAISVSMAELIKMVQVRVRGAIRPAKSGPGGTVTTTSGVETAWEKYITLHSTQGIAMDKIIYTMEVALLWISSSSVVEDINAA